MMDKVRQGGMLVPIHKDVQRIGEELTRRVAGVFDVLVLGIV